eukprot:1973551-Rhodomonas_salina.1
MDSAMAAAPESPTWLSPMSTCSSLANALNEYAREITPLRRRAVGVVVGACCQGRERRAGTESLQSLAEGRGSKVRDEKTVKDAAWSPLWRGRVQNGRFISGPGSTIWAEGERTYCGGSYKTDRCE